MSDTVVKIYDTATVVQAVEQQTVVKFPVSLPGPQGPIGPAGGSAVSYVAGENLSSGRAVIMDGGEVYYFQPTNAAHAGRLYGVTTTAASIGTNVTIQIGGEISNVAFTFSADAGIYVGANGVLQTSKPGSGLVQYAGVSVTGTKIRLEIWPSVQL